MPLIRLFVVSLLDDMHSLPVKKRLLAHLAAAAILVAGSGWIFQQELALTWIGGVYSGLLMCMDRRR